MILKKKIPNDFYKLFRTKNREAYMQFVTAIYEENNEVYASLGLTQEECALIIENTIEKSKIVWQEEDDMEEGETPDATGGIIYINGIPVEAYDCKTFYKEICYISQEEMLLNESVEDYLRYAAHADLKPDNIEQMRRNVKLRPEIKKIEENGATLSGGEKKKLLMLKWLLNPSTSFVILDEIDAGLDDETKVVLKELEKELLKDRKKIVMKISHIDEDMDGYDQIIRL